MPPLCTVVAVGILSLQPSEAPVSRTMSGATHQVFRLTVPAGQFVTGVVNQGDTDLSVTICGPDRQVLARIDASDRGEEAASFVAPNDGEYRLLVAPLTRTSRRVTYRIHVEPFRPATAGDDRLLEAQRAASEAKELMASGTADRLRAALTRLDTARQIFRERGNRPSELASAIRTGEAWLALNQYAQAEAAYADARRLNEDVRDDVLQARILNGLALIAWPRGEIGEALRLIEDAVERCRKAGFLYGEAASLNNRGLVLWEAGEYDRAIRDYRRVIELVRTLGETRGEAFATNNLALVLDEIGRPGEAATYLERAAALFRRVADPVAEGRSLVSLARVQLALDKPQTSLRTVQRGLRLIVPTGNLLAEANGLREHGRILERLGERQRAREYFEQALDRYRRANSRRGESEALHALGLDALGTGNCAKAVDFLEHAFTIRRQSGLRRLAIESQFRTALAMRACDDLEGARRHLEHALADVEALRAGVAEKEQQSSFLSSRLQYYNAYVDVLVDLHRRQPSGEFARLALEASERARARELTERLLDTWTGVTGVGNRALLDRQRDLRNQINYWSWQMWQRSDRLPAPDAEADVRRTISRLEAELNEVEGQIDRSDPRYAALRRATGPVPIAAVQRDILDDETALIEFALGDEKSYLWVVTRQRIVLAELPPRGTIEAAARTLHQAMRSAPDGTAPDAERRRRAAAALERVLLSPVAAALDARRLLIVPDGALHYVPFGVLRHPADRRPLVERHELVTLPSVTALAVLRRERASGETAPLMMALIGDPVFDSLDARLGPSHRSPGSSQPGQVARRLERLAFGAEAAERIFQRVPRGEGLKATGLQATRELATGPELAKYRIIHFDTHGFQDDVRPDLSGIALSMVDARGTSRDGFVRLHDVYGLRLRAELVVLSACETGIGRQRGSEGVASLARGFLSAGARRVVSTLWAVNDEATAALMERFYAGLLGSAAMTPAAALRDAQLSIRRDPRWRDPYFWAGFVLQGDA